MNLRRFRKIIETAQIARLELHDGDVVLFRVPDGLSAQEHHMLKEVVRSTFAAAQPSTAIETLLVPEGVTVEILGRAMRPGEREMNWTKTAPNSGIAP